MRMMGRRPMGRLFYWPLIVALTLALGAGEKAMAVVPGKTVVSDTLYRADGGLAQGTVLISWSAFTTQDGATVAAGSSSTKIGADGSLSVSLVPNVGSTPQSYYKVTLKLADRTTSEEYWVVPAQGPVTVTSIRSKMVPASVAVQYASRDYVDGKVAGVSPADPATLVHTSGNESVAGVKTFLAPPSVPAPAGAQDAATKKYVDDATAPALRSTSTYSDPVWLSSLSATKIAGTLADAAIPASVARTAGVNTWTQPQSFSGAVTATAGMKSTNVDGTIHLNGSGSYTLNDAGIHQAVADCVAQGGGRVQPTADVTITSMLSVGGLTTSRKPCVLDLSAGNGVTLTVDVRDGGTGIQLFDGAAIAGNYGFQPFGSSKYGGRIKAAATANVAKLIANGEATGNQQGVSITGVQIQGDPAATVGTMVSLVNLHSGTTVQDSFIAYFRGIGLEVACDASAPDQQNDTVNYFKNLVIGGIRPSTARPVVLHTTGGATCGLGDIQFDFLDVEGAGTGNPQVEIAGSGTQVAMAGSTVKGIHFNGGYCEPTIGSNSDCFRITNAGAVTIRDFSANADGTGSGVKIAHTLANGVGLIAVDNVSSSGGAYSINNTINSDQKPVTTGRTGLVQHYDYDETRVDVGMNSFASQHQYLKALNIRVGPLTGLGTTGLVPNGLPGAAALEVEGDGALASGGSTVGQIHLQPTSGVNNQMAALTFGANTNGNVNQSCNGGVFAESSSGFGLKMHFATTGSFGTCTFRWTLNYNGHWLAYADNSYDLGASGANRPRSGYFGTSVTAPTMNATTGFQVGGAAATGNVLRGNGTNFVGAQLAAADLSNGVSGSGAVALASGASLSSPTLTTPNLGVATATSLDLSKLTMSSAGVVTKYNNVTTAGTGVGPIYGSVSLTAQGATIGATSAYASAPAGLYRVCYDVQVTRAATTSSSINVTVGWNNGSAQTKSSTAVSSNALNAEDGNCYVVDSAASQNITYATTYSSSGTTTMQYALRVTVEQLQ